MTFKEQQSSSFSASLEVEYDGAFTSAKFGAKMSRDQNSAKEFFSSGKGMMLIAEAKCYTHWQRIHKVKPPKVNGGQLVSGSSFVFLVVLLVFIKNYLGLFLTAIHVHYSKYLGDSDSAP